MKLKSCILAMLVAVGTSQAASVIVATTGDGGAIAGGSARGVYDNSGAALAFGGGFTAVGSFVGSAPDFGSSNGADIGSAFTLLGSTSTFGITLGSTNINGLFSLNGSAAISAGNPLIGSPIYFVAGNGATFASSTQLLVINFGANFAADNPAFNASFNLQAGDGTVVFGTEEFNGATSPLFGAFNGAANSYQMANLVPEPSMALLGALGIVGLLRRRR